MSEQGQLSQEPPCIFLDENGKHPWTVWTYTHKPGYKFWIPKCDHCGYVDTDGILKEIAEKGLLTPTPTTAGKEFSGYMAEKKELDFSEPTTAGKEAGKYSPAEELAYKNLGLKELDRNELLGTLAQAYCTVGNSHKAVDPDLISSMCDLILLKYGQRQISEDEIEKWLNTKSGAQPLYEADSFGHTHTFNDKQLAKAIKALLEGK